MKKTIKHHMRKVELVSHDYPEIEFEGELPKCCGTCVHFDKLITEEPCFICEYYNKYERQKA